MPPTEWVDDPTITNDEVLWRRIHPSQIKLDPGTKNLIASSGAFRDAQMSVHIASLTNSDIVLANYPQHSLIAFTAGIARSQGCIVVRDPKPDDPSHALVCRKNPNQRLTKSQAREIRRQAIWVVLRPPP